MWLLFCPGVGGVHFIEFCFCHGELFVRVLVLVWVVRVWGWWCCLSTHLKFELLFCWFGGWKRGFLRRIESVVVVLLVGVEVCDVVLVDIVLVDIGAIDVLV